MEVKTQSYEEFNQRGEKNKIRATSLEDFIEVEHKENESREIGELEKPIQMPIAIETVNREEVLRSIRWKEIERDGQKFMSVSIIYDLEGREIPVEEANSVEHEMKHWTTYLGMALFSLSRVVKGQ
jgi:hypothetical protein